MFRCRSLSHATSMEGPEMASSSPRMPSGIQRPSPKNVARMLEKILEAPSASPDVRSDALAQLRRLIERLARENHHREGTRSAGQL